uniref:Uncharacterized protein n=1 Tax=Ciona savignyi TaxID=51511 RepID=H2ZBD2_CIOSA
MEVMKLYNRPVSEDHDELEETSDNSETYDGQIGTKTSFQTVQDEQQKDSKEAEQTDSSPVDNTQTEDIAAENASAIHQSVLQNPFGNEESATSTQLPYPPLKPETTSPRSLPSRSIGSPDNSSNNSPGVSPSRRQRNRATRRPKNNMA